MERSLERCTESLTCGGRNKSSIHRMLEFRRGDFSAIVPDVFHNFSCAFSIACAISSCTTEAIMEIAMEDTSTKQTMPGGMWNILDRQSFTPMNTRTMATPYLRRENTLTRTSMMKNV